MRLPSRLLDVLLLLGTLGLFIASALLSLLRRLGLALPRLLGMLCLIVLIRTLLLLGVLLVLL
jgi:hypothetical protein